MSSFPDRLCSIIKCWLLSFIDYNKKVESRLPNHLGSVKKEIYLILIILRLRLILQSWKSVTHQIVMKFWQNWCTRRWNIMVWDPYTHQFSLEEGRIAWSMERIYYFTSFQDYSNYHGMSLLWTSYKIFPVSFSQG
jgi:hypothetical protein